MNRDSRTGTLHAHARWCSPDACSPYVGRCNRSNARRGSGMSTGRAARGSAVCRHQGIADRNGAWNFVSAGPKPQPATPAQEVLAGLVERVRYGKGSNLSVPRREGMVRNRRTSADRFRSWLGRSCPERAIRAGDGPAPWISRKALLTFQLIILEAGSIGRGSGRQGKRGDQALHLPVQRNTKRVESVIVQQRDAEYIR